MIIMVYRESWTDPPAGNLIKQPSLWRLSNNLFLTLFNHWLTREGNALSVFNMFCPSLSPWPMVSCYKGSRQVVIVRRNVPISGPILTTRMAVEQLHQSFENPGHLQMGFSESRLFPNPMMIIAMANIEISLCLLLLKLSMSCTTQ